MRVLIVVNMSSGRGRAGRLAHAIDEALASRGHDVARLELGGPRRDLRLEAGLDAAVVVGGDGTIHAFLDELIRTQTPVYHAPAGTENLFAREFAMVDKPGPVVDAIEAGDVRPMDVGRANGEAFAIMGSIGWDASVIHRLHTIRRGSISHASYVRPILSQILRFPRSVLTIRVDGEALVQDRPGLVVIANSRQYAMRLDPCCRARPDDGLLDMVFLPYRSPVGLATWSVLARVGAHQGAEHVVEAKGERIEVRGVGPGACLQLDGEAVGTVPEDDAPASLTFEVEPGVLRVIRPPALSPH